MLLFSLMTFWRHGSISIFFIELAECPLCICLFKASTWPSMRCHKTCHCLFSDNKWGESIENTDSTTQGICFLSCFWNSCSVKLLKFSSIFFFAPFEIQDAIEKLLIWFVWMQFRRDGPLGSLVVAPLEALTDEVVPYRQHAFCFLPCLRFCLSFFHSTTAKTWDELYKVQ